MLAGNWKSDRAARGYMDSSMRTLRRIADCFDMFTLTKPSVENVPLITTVKTSDVENKDRNSNTTHIYNFYNSSNCSINLANSSNSLNDSIKENSKTVEEAPFPKLMLRLPKRSFDSIS